MTQLNSPFLTALQRRYLPVIISVVLLGILGAILAPPFPPARVVVIAVVVIALVALTYFLVYRSLVYPTADRVVLDGKQLRVTRGGQEAVIPVENISGIHSTTGINPETITLDLIAESPIGRSITFIPPSRLPSDSEHPILAQLRTLMRPA